METKGYALTPEQLGGLEVDAGMMSLMEWIADGERARREVVALRRLLWLVLMEGAAPGETVRRITIPESAVFEWEESRSELSTWPSPDPTLPGLTIQARLLPDGER